jgi:ATP-dependent RNA helicase DeaD
VELDEEDRELAGHLMERLSPEAIAATLVRALRADLPAPEDILALGGRDERGEPGPRPGFEGSTWFVINAGRRHNADPRWLLPLICRYGHVGRNDIGAIRVAANESYFEVTQRAAPGFIKALRRATIAPEDEGLVIEQAPPRVEGAAPHARPSRAPQHFRPKRQHAGARSRAR